MKPVFVELLSFLRRHWLHALLSPFLGFIACSALHEASHAAAAMAQGATITEFTCWPGKGFLGHVSYDFPEGVRPNHTAILLAPYATSLTILLGVLLVAIRAGRLPFWLGSTLFIWGWIASFGNIGIAVAGYLRGSRRTDLIKVFGGPDILPGALLLLLLTCGAVGGFWIQRELYRERALSPGAFAVLAVATVAAIAAAAAAGRMM